MKRSNFALRLQPSLMDEARMVAEAEGVALNQLINVAVAEKLSAMRTASFFAERRGRADVAGAMAIHRALDKTAADPRGLEKMGRAAEAVRELVG